MSVSRDLVSVVDVTPVLDTSAYATGDQMGAVFEIPNATPESSGTATLNHLLVIDSALQSLAFELWLFKNEPTLASTDNAAFDITDANLLAAEPIGIVPIAAADYKATASNSVASMTASTFTGNVGDKIQSAVGSTSIWGVLVARGAPTYAADSLKLRISLDQD